MPLEQKINYTPCEGVKYTQKETDKIINLIVDVRRNAALLNSGLRGQRLDLVLDNIEKGNWIIQDVKKTDPKNTWVCLNYNLDLSEARKIINEYNNKRLSEKEIMSPDLKEIIKNYKDDELMSKT